MTERRLDTAVVLAAGKGKRLQPLTASRTKAMAPVAGKPIVARVMESLAAHGVQRFILVVSPEDSQITSYFAASPHEIRFVLQPERKGMGDALLHAAPFITGDFILSACDNLMETADIAQALAAWQVEPLPQAVLSLLRVSAAEIPHTGIVALQEGWVTRIVEKPALTEAPSDIASIPLYIFTSSFLDYLPSIRPSARGEYELQDAIQNLIQHNLATQNCSSVRGVLVAQRMTLTNTADLLALNLHYLAQEQPLVIQTDKIGTDFQPRPPLWVDPGVVIGAHCQLGPNVFVESGCVIPDGAMVQNAVVLREAILK